MGHGRTAPGKSRELKYYWQLWNAGGISIRNGLVWYKWIVDGTTLKWEMIIPQAYQAKVLETPHGHPATGHFEENRSIHRMIKVPIFWFRCY